jgi:predicted DNA binding CopG/RHH family protein
MKKPSPKMKKRAVLDAQIEEFEARDLGSDIRASGVTPVVIHPKQRPTSILLEPELVEQLRVKGSKRGLGYQTMLKLIVREHLHEY